MGSLIRKILRYVGVPTEEEIAQRIQAAEAIAKSEGHAEGRNAGRAEAAFDYETKLEELTERYNSELDALRKGMLSQDELAQKEAFISRRMERLRSLEQKASAASDSISTREVQLIIAYANTLNENYKVRASDSCDILLTKAQKQEWKLSIFKQDFINNFTYLDKTLGDDRGYKLLNWIAEDFLHAEEHTITDARILLRYFRALASVKGGAEDVAVKIDKCIADSKYYNVLKPHAQKKVQQIDDLHKKYIQELDSLSKDLLDERGAKGSFETMIESSRKGDAHIVLGRDGIASRITRLRELDTYEKEHNINLYDYKNQETL